MRIVLLHANYIEWQAVKPALKSAEQTDNNLHRVEECVVVFTSVEEGDNEETIEKAVKSVEEYFHQVKPSSIVIYPWVHLSSTPAKPSIALKLIKLLEEKLKEKFTVYRAPFGWYKSFTLSVKGHPLAELSRTL